MTLQKLVENVRSAPDIRASGAAFRISGNHMELKIPLCLDRTDSCREAIIEAGRMISRLSREAEKAGCMLQVRPFPTLDRPDLVALATLQRSKNGRITTSAALAREAGGSGDTGSVMDHGSLSSDGPASGDFSVEPGALPAGTDPHLLQELQELASRHGLSLLPLPEGPDRAASHAPVPARESAAVSTDTRSGASPSSGKRSGRNPSYALCSRSDNPFVWIETGQWIEEVSHQFATCPPSRAPRLSWKLPEPVRISSGDELPSEVVAVQATLDFPC